ncbi:MAG: CoA transferase [Candidatus Nezhaarchaeota archaeon]|nr:CoA transferase [Candidatus Nezhaarchaeota archaeon]
MSDYFEYVEKLFKGGEKREPPLKGIRVVEMTHYVYGPTVGAVLAQFGADVVKVEPMGEGDRFRLGAVWMRMFKKGQLQFLTLNANKYFITLDARSRKAREILLRLVAKADVFIENFRAGLLDALGLGYLHLSKINPKIIYVSCSGYGQYGPLSRAPSFDVSAQGIIGVAMKSGWPDVDEFYKLPDYFGDYFPAMIAAAAVISALYYRERTGKGQYIDVSQAESLFRFFYDITYLTLTGEEIGKTGNIDPLAIASGIFATSDGKFVAIAIMDEEQLLAISRAMNIDLVSQYKGKLRSKECINELSDLISKWASSRTLDEIMNYAKTYGFPASPVFTDFDVYRDSWRWERGSIIEFDDRIYGKVHIPVLPIHLSATPPKIKWLARPVGYHNRLILKKWLGYTDEEIKKLEEEGVIGYWDQAPGMCPPDAWDVDNDPVFKGERDECE